MSKDFIKIFILKQHCALSERYFNNLYASGHDYADPTEDTVC